MNEEKKEELKNLNTIRFIEATRELIDEEGVENISVRKIANRAGFHNSTIYLYFKDLNELIMLASLKHFDEYSKALSQQSQNHLSDLNNFFSVWESFAASAFKDAPLFLNFFFGKHGNNLTEIITKYYSLFPEEKQDFSHEISAMYYGTNISERCRIMLELIIGAKGSRITEENCNLVNEIIISSLKFLLEETFSDHETTAEKQAARLMDVIRYVVSE